MGYQIRKKQITLYLAPETIERLRRVVFTTRTPRTQIIETAINDYLADLEKAEARREQ